MKKLVFILFISPVIFFGQNWQWAKFYGANCVNYAERTNSIFSDGTDYYVVGAYGCQLYLPGGSTMMSNGRNDIFISKFDVSGNLIWAKTIGSNFNQGFAYENANGVFDPVNNCIYIGGYIVGSVSFPGGITVNADPNSQDVFVARMDLNGNFVWVKTTGAYGNSGLGNDNSQVFVEPDGDVLLTGRIEDTCFFGSFSVPSGGFIARYDKDGNCKWAANKFNGGMGVHIDFIDSDIVIGASYNNSSSYLDTAILASNGSYDGLITRMDSVGNIKWVKKFGFSGIDAVEGIGVNSANEIFVAGAFTDSVKIDGFSLYNSTQEILIMKIDENGNVMWAKKANNNGTYGAGIDITPDSNTGCYVTGLFAGNFSMNGYNATSSNLYDMFLTRLDSNGNCMGLVSFGVAEATHLYVDATGAIYCTGTFKNTITIGSTTLSSYDGQDIYVAKLDAITGINNNTKLSQNNSLTIYANPNKGTFNIKVPDEVKDFDGAVLLVYDKQGKEVGKFNLDEKSADKNHPHFNVSNTAPGTYIVKLIQKGKVFTGQLVLEE
jgi:hypothetical protein